MPIDRVSPFCCRQTTPSPVSGLCVLLPLTSLVAGLLSVTTVLAAPASPQIVRRQTDPSLVMTGSQPRAAGPVAEMREASRNTPPASVPAPALHLTVLAEGQALPVHVSQPKSDGDPTLSAKKSYSFAPATCCYSFGQVGALSAAGIEHTFVLRNDNKTAVTVKQLQASSGSLTAQIGGAKAAAPFAPQILKPGEEVPLRLALLRPATGVVADYLWVIIDGQAAPAASIEMTGTVVPDFRVSPPSLDLSDGGTGSEPSAVLNVQISKSLLGTGFAPRVTCSNRDIFITPSPSRTSPSADGENLVTQSYRLTLNPKAGAGTVKGTVCVSLGPGGTNGSRDIAIQIVPLSGRTAGQQTAFASTKSAK